MANVVMTKTTNTAKVDGLSRTLSWVGLIGAIVTTALLVGGIIAWSWLAAIPLGIVGVTSLGAALFALLLSLFAGSQTRPGVRARAGLAAVVLVAVLVLANVLTLAAL